MPHRYDELYRNTPHALGAPTASFVDFFRDLEEVPRRVLDVGCGQGRDAIFIARMGHKVVAVDLSPYGIRDLNATAKDENLEIEALVADITSWTPGSQYDIVLIDRTLHMLPTGMQLNVLSRLLNYVAEDGYVLIADEPSNLPGMKGIFMASQNIWRPVWEKAGYLFMKQGGERP